MTKGWARTAGNGVPPSGKTLQNTMHRVSRHLFVEHFGKWCILLPQRRWWIRNTKNKKNQRGSFGSCIQDRMKTESRFGVDGRAYLQFFTALCFQTIFLWLFFLFQASATEMFGGKTLPNLSWMHLSIHTQIRLPDSTWKPWLPLPARRQHVAYLAHLNLSIRKSTVCVRGFERLGLRLKRQR